jgi:prophage DNA circulation protein
MSETIDTAEVRRTVRQTIEAADSITRQECIEAVAATADAPESVVDEQLDLLEREGFIYLVNGEVRLP